MHTLACQSAELTSRLKLSLRDVALCVSCRQSRHSVRRWVWLLTPPMWPRCKVSWHSCAPCHRQQPTRCYAIFWPASTPSWPTTTTITTTLWLPQQSRQLWAATAKLWQLRRRARRLRSLRRRLRSSQRKPSCPRHQTTRRHRHPQLVRCQGPVRRSIAGEQYGAR